MIALAGSFAFDIRQILWIVALLIKGNGDNFAFYFVH